MKRQMSKEVFARLITTFIQSQVGVRELGTRPMICVPGVFFSVRSGVKLPSCQKTSDRTAGANQCAQIFEHDFESVSYLRITFPRKYQTLSKIGKLKN